MQMSLKGTMELAGHEAIVLGPGPYYDSVKVLTCLVGHTKSAGPPDPATTWGKTFTPQEALAVLQHDVAHSEARVRSAFKRPINQEQFDAAVSFDVNTGAITYATWVKKYNAGNRAGAVAGIMSWNKPAEIKGRRAKEQKLFDKGVYSNGGFATVYSTDGKGHVLWKSGKRVNLAALLAPPKLPPAANVVKAAAPKAGIISLVPPANKPMAAPSASKFASPGKSPLGFIASLFHKAA